MKKTIFALAILCGLFVQANAKEYRYLASRDICVATQEQMKVLANEYANNAEASLEVAMQVAENAPPKLPVVCYFASAEAPGPIFVIVVTDEDDWTRVANSGDSTLLFHYKPVHVESFANSPNEKLRDFALGKRNMYTIAKTIGGARAKNSQ